jgi:hypothetical protein
LIGSTRHLPGGASPSRGSRPLQQNAGRQVGWTTSLAKPPGSAQIRL